MNVVCRAKGYTKPVCFAVVKHLEGYKVNELFVLVFS